MDLFLKKIKQTKVNRRKATLNSFKSFYDALEK